MLSPLSWGLVLAVVLLFAWRRLTRGWRAAAAATGVVFWLLAAPVGANTLQWWLESMVSGDARCGARDRGPIVLLSGGFEREPVDVEDYVSFRFETWRRVRDGVDAWHADGRGDFWIAGGGPYALKESALQARLARDWRVPEEVLRIDTESTTTWSSAFVLQGALPHAVRLVTSPGHQARALMAFRAAGFDACAIDVGSDRSHFGGALSLWPQVSSLEKAEMAIYELVGLVWYRVRAWRLDG
jgi:uncharacterized SAM-binding protein YcdF (DUF218 family)